MKVLTVFAVCLFLLTIVAGTANITRHAAAQDKKPPETIVLAKEAKLGQVAFNHLKHATENRSADLSKPIACVDCHHTAQPAAEAAKVPLHKTAYPADRTTTLTMDLIEKDPNAVGAICTDCHARSGEKPKLLPELPKVSFEGGSE